MFPPRLWRRTLGVRRGKERERGSWIGTRRVTLPHVSSSPPFRTVRAAFTAYGSTPAVLLLGQNHQEASLRISPAYTEYTVDSLRVRWVPLLLSFRRLGAFAIRPHPGVHSFPVLRLLCPIRLSPQASRFRATFPSHYFPLRLPSLGESPVSVMENSSKMA